jgi:hypothetical protein
MNKTTVCTCFALILFSACALDSWAADFVAAPPQGNWNKVQNLAQGANLTVHINGGTEYTGEFVSLGDNSIFIKDMGQEREFPKSSVSQIGLNRQGSRARNAAIVGGIVGAIGFGIGYASAARALDKNSASGGERAAIGGIFGGVWGGVAAAIAAAHKPGVHEEIIFQSK